MDAEADGCEPELKRFTGMTTSPPISILLADDHALVRSTLAAWLKGIKDFTVLGSVATGDEAVAEAIRLQPDVVLLDIEMPGCGAFEVARTIMARSPHSRVVFLTAFINDRYIEQALHVQASGYVTKTESPEAVAHVIRSVASGVSYYSPEARRRIIVDSSGTRLAVPGPVRASLLSRRELELVQYIAKGLSKKEIAQTTHLSVKTVNRHVANIMAKLDIHDRVELTRFAIREELVEP